MQIARRRSKSMEMDDDKSLVENTVMEGNVEKFDGDDSEGTSKDKDEHIEEVADEMKLQPSTTPNRADHESNHKQEVDSDDDELESARAEMGRVREENERLKLSLVRRMKDYKDLQIHFLEVVQKQETNTRKTVDHEQGSASGEALVPLSLGRTSSISSTHEIMTKKNDRNNEMNNEAGLELELGYRSFEPASNDHDDSLVRDSKQNEVNETWVPSKILKTREEDVTQHLTSHLKTTRVSVRARCDAPTLNDGCQWRKYGQKIAKGNPCPRAYYRCTVSPSCPVRKQVQRCAEDMSILITTYEGNHNHPLPMSATAMASTTSAAASMLQSHSSTSQNGLVNSTMASISSSTSNPFSNLPNFTTGVSQNASRFYFPNTTISTNNSHPTITLDLTSPPPPSQFGLRFPSNLPRYSSTSLNFSTSSSSSFDQNTLLQGPNWIDNAGYYNRMNQLAVGGSPFNVEKQPFQEHNLYNSYVRNSQKTSPSPSPSQHHVFTETTIETATKAITSSPMFQSALAAALTSFVGTNNNGSTSHVVNASSSSSSESSGLKLK